MNHEEMKTFFKNDRFANLIGAQIESITPTEVTCILNLKEHHLNGGDKVQGGVIFTLADFAFAVACNYDGFSENNQTITVSHSCNINFFKTPVGKKLIAKTKCLQKGRKLSVYRITIVDDLGTIVAEMTGNSYTLKPAS